MMDELLDIYDKNGKKTGVIKKRGDKLQEGEFNFAIELWVINSKNEILIQKRAACRKVLPNIWGMTTGYIKSGEDTQSGCIREAKEEIDLEILKEDLNLICNLTHGNTMWDVFAVKKSYDISRAILQKEEVSEIRWVSINEFKEMINNGKAFKYSEIYDILNKIQEILMI
ncbi:NUDIX domain-containing protein [Clostridium botulinum]|nr:NUDIX hydrolase [Clostridium botulinum]KFX57684.1 NUDIX hydrolase [Clostridium botulinum]KON12264.1 NUDIX hydrolase [Clostridium botulinum]MBY6778214.1 NUDIX domain-containing protein [Clostridium botulinum]MBY6803100.1 NUDIX domain-containing protein [Clostridium botulinum]